MVACGRTLEHWKYQGSNEIKEDKLILNLMTASDLCVSYTKWLTEAFDLAVLSMPILEFMKTVTIKENAHVVDDSHKVQGSTTVYTASLNSLQSIHLTIKLNIKSTVYFEAQCHSGYSICQHIHNPHDSQ